MRRVITAGTLLAVYAVLLAGCSRMRAPAPSPPEAPPAEPEPAYVLVAGEFLTSLEEGRPRDAYALIQPSAQKVIQYTQFVADFQDLGLKGHRLVADVGAGDAAYVVAAVDTAPTEGEAAVEKQSFGLLLRRAEDTWRVASWVPQGEALDAYPNLSLERAGDRDFKVTYSGPEGASRTVMMIEF